MTRETTYKLLDGAERLDSRELLAGGAETLSYMARGAVSRSAVYRDSVHRVVILVPDGDAQQMLRSPRVCQEIQDAVLGVYGLEVRYG